MCLALAAGAWGQALGPVREPPMPPVPQKMPMGYRPIRPPQLAPLQTIQTRPAPDVQIPLAPPADPWAAYRAPQMNFPPGVIGRPGQPVPYNNVYPGQVLPGQPLQPVPQQPFAAPTYYPPPPSQPASYLTWSTERQETNTQVGQISVPFTFWLTNVSTEVVSVNAVRTSCGCTVAQLPEQPWRIPPGSNGPIQVTMNLAGKFGSIEKSVTVDSTTGYKSLIVRANIPQQPNAQPVSNGIDPERLKNMQMALADRQVLFKGECAKCHAEPAVAKMDKPLYDAACGICHDSIHRAAMVPDLAKLNHPTNEEHWRKWIRSGRVGSMMPAFAKTEGGPLTDEQVDSLVKFLMESITAKAPPQNKANPVATSAQFKAQETAHDTAGPVKTKLQ
jgi:mono/diheme cytochrome c family protein